MKAFKKYYYTLNQRIAQKEKLQVSDKIKGLKVRLAAQGSRIRQYGFFCHQTGGD